MARLYTVRSGKLVEYHSYCEAFGRNPMEKIQIAAVGGGGKSTILSEIAEEYARLGRSVVSTTTTHIVRPEKAILEEDIRQVKEALQREKIVVVGNCIKGSDKLNGVSESFLEQLREVADCVLVEADGAKMLPLKVPGEREPVIPLGTDFVLGIAGIRGLGKPIREVIHRSEIAAKVLHKSVEQKVDIVDISILLTSDCGQRKNVGGIRYIPILNQVALEGEWENAKKIVERVKGGWIR